MVPTLRQRKSAGAFFSAIENFYENEIKKSNSDGKSKAPRAAWIWNMLRVYVGTSGMRHAGEISPSAGIEFGELCEKQSPSTPQFIPGRVTPHSGETPGYVV